MMAATDSRTFTEISDRVYRFAPFRMTKAQREAIHSYDEHLGVDDVPRRRALVPAADREARLMAATTRPSRSQPVHGLVAIVGFLVCVELASGVLQGYYTPIFSDIADHLGIADADVNWFEAAQLIVSALVVPPLARLGDLVGHKKVLLLSTAVTALGSWVLAFAPGFTTFLDRLGDPGRVRRLAAAGDLDHPPPHGEHRPAGTAHPAGRRPSWSAPSSSR